MFGNALCADKHVYIHVYICVYLYMNLYTAYMDSGKLYFLVKWTKTTTTTDEFSTLD